MTKITPIQLRGLQATAEGEVFRVYRADGNILHSKWVSSRTLWALDKNGWIKDGAESFGKMHVTVKQVLTPPGAKVLADNSETE